MPIGLRMELAGLALLALHPAQALPHMDALHVQQATRARQSTARREGPTPGQRPTPERGQGNANAAQLIGWQMAKPVVDKTVEVQGTETSMPRAANSPAGRKAVV